MRGRGEDADVVVPQPTCGYVLKKDYVDYVGGPDAELVAEHTYDAAEYLMKVHKAEGTALDTDFPGEVPEHDHLPRALPPAGPEHRASRAATCIKLTGAKITLVAECSGIDGTWGYRERELRDQPQGRAKKMADAIEKAGADAVAGDCHLANGGIVQETGTPARAPAAARGPGLRHPRGLTRPR